MCTTGPSAPTTKAITITISATTAVPWPLTISDGTLTSTTDDGDQNFVTNVNAGDSIAFVTAGDITEIVSIQAKPGNPDLFSTDPSSSNRWTGVLGAKTTNVESYNITYNVRGNDGPYTQDPRIQFNP